MTRTEQRVQALDILANCEAGATELSLTSLGIERAILNQLVARGAIETWVQHLHSPRIDVRWYGLKGE